MSRFQRFSFIIISWRSQHHMRLIDHRLYVFNLKKQHCFPLECGSTVVFGYTQRRRLVSSRGSAPSRAGRLQGFFLEITILLPHFLSQHNKHLEEVPFFSSWFLLFYPFSISSSLKCVRWSGMQVEKRRSQRHLFLSPSLCKDASEHPWTTWILSYMELCKPAALLVICISVKRSK